MKLKRQNNIGIWNHRDKITLAYEILQTKQHWRMKFYGQNNIGKWNYVDKTTRGLEVLEPTQNGKINFRNNFQTSTSHKHSLPFRPSLKFMFFFKNALENMQLWLLWWKKIWFKSERINKHYKNKDLSRFLELEFN